MRTPQSIPSCELEDLHRGRQPSRPLRSHQHNLRDAGACPNRVLQSSPKESPTGRDSYGPEIPKSPAERTTHSRFTLSVRVLRSIVLR